MILNYLSDLTEDFNGTPTSEFNNIRLLNDDTLITFTKNDRQCVITYADFRNQILKDIYNDIIGVKSMAYESKNGYALINHTHDNNYNKLTIGNVNGGNTQLFMVQNRGIVTPTTTTNISAQMIVVENPIETKIGQVKLIYSPNPLNVTTFGSNFDGWVYANGQTITITQLNITQSEFLKSETYKAFGASTTTLVVPDLQTFIRASNKNITDYSTIPYRTGYPSHKHTIQDNIINMKFEKDDNETKIKTYSNYVAKNGKNHHGQKSSSNLTCEVTFNTSQINMPEFNSEYSGYTNCESYPTHSLVRVMIYIGFKRK